jgi:uracil phosphoribosyltransferase
LNENIMMAMLCLCALGMSEAMLELLPNAATHHIGMYRLKGSKMPVQYYNRLPKNKVADVAFVLDPIIASGITVAATVGQLKLWGCKKIIVVSLIATAQGVASLAEQHPDVQLFVAQASDELTESGRALPGLGDAGDRQFNCAVRT